MYSSYYTGAATTAGIGLVLMFLAFIAAIVVTVLLYRKYISSQKPVRVPGSKRDWGSFFRFENLIVEKILQALFIFTACLIAFECAASILTSIVSIVMVPYGAGAALISVIVTLIVFVVLEVINRIGFEFSIMTVLICKNTSAIRLKVCGDNSQAVRFAGDDSSDQPDVPTVPAGQSPVAGAAAPTSADTNRFSRYNTQQYSAHANHAEKPAAPAAPAVPSSSTEPTAPTAPATPQPHAEDKAKHASAPEASKPDNNKASSSWTCSKCGHTNHSGKFCSQCGNPRA